MTAWWSGKAVLLDLETDSKEPDDARIIQSCTAYIGDGSSMPLTQIVKPERPIPDEAAGIHGITTERAEAEGVDRETALRWIIDDICRAGEDRPVIAHNARYDLTVLDREMRRLGIGSLGIGGMRPDPPGGPVVVRIDGRAVAAFYVIDTLVLDKHVDPYRKGKRQLPVTAEFYGVPMGGAHDAEVDALAAGRVAWAIAKRCAMPISEVAEFYRNRRDSYEVAHTFAALGRMDLRTLHESQGGWAMEQAVSLSEYFARNPDKGDPFKVSPHWPLEPVPVESITSEVI